MMTVTQTGGHDDTHTDTQPCRVLTGQGNTHTDTQQDREALTWHLCSSPEWSHDQNWITLLSKHAPSICCLQISEQRDSALERPGPISAGWLLCSTFDAAVDTGPVWKSLMVLGPPAYLWTDSCSGSDGCWVAAGSTCFQIVSRETRQCSWYRHKASVWWCHHAPSSEVRISRVWFC